MHKKRGDREFLLDMLHACNNIIKYTKNLNRDDFCNNDLIRDAVIRNIEILGEASKRISNNLKQKYPEVEWSQISRTRDKIIHYYFGVNPDIIWDIVTKNIPPLLKKLQFILKKEGWI